MVVVAAASGGQEAAQAGPRGAGAVGEKWSGWPEP